MIRRDLSRKVTYRTRNIERRRFTGSQALQPGLIYAASDLRKGDGAHLLQRNIGVPVERSKTDYPSPGFTVRIRTKGVACGVLTGKAGPERT